jgi:O-antigen/teichoic acid export membrane protein
VDKILLGRYKGTAVVAIYSVGYMLYQYYMMFSTSISSVFTPKIHRIVQETKDDKEKCRERLTSLFVRVGRIQFILLGLVATGVIFFGMEFITRYWAGAEYTDAYYVALLLILPATIALIQNIGIEVQRAQNKHKFRAIVYIFMALSNVVMSVFLCKLYGAVGSAVGTAISLIVANGIIMNIYYHKCCNINVLRFWKGILRACVGLIIPVACGVLMNMYLDISNTWLYIAAIVAYVIIYIVSMWFLGMNEYERSLATKPMKKVMNKFYGKSK